MESQFHFQDSLKEGEPLEREKERLPDNWTTLYHGSNLARIEWQGEKRDTLDGEELVLDGGLSVISEEERMRVEKEKEGLRERGIVGSHGGTTETYSLNVSEGLDEPLEIQIIFPSFHRRKAGYKDVESSYRERYGKDITDKIIALSDSVYWRNHQDGRHPLLPKKMTLIKTSDTLNEGNKRVVRYVPKEIFSIYEQEIKIEESD